MDEIGHKEQNMNRSPKQRRTWTSNNNTCYLYLLIGLTTFNSLFINTSCNYIYSSKYGQKRTSPSALALSAYKSNVPSPITYQYRSIRNHELNASTPSRPKLTIPTSSMKSVYFSTHDAQLIDRFVNHLKINNGDWSKHGIQRLVRLNSDCSQNYVSLRKTRIKADVPFDEAFRDPYTVIEQQIYRKLIVLKSKQTGRYVCLNQTRGYFGLRSIEDIDRMCVFTFQVTTKSDSVSQQSTFSIGSNKAVHLAFNKFGRMIAQQDEQVEQDSYSHHLHQCGHGKSYSFHVHTKLTDVLVEEAAEEADLYKKLNEKYKRVSTSRASLSSTTTSRKVFSSTTTTTTTTALSTRLIVATSPKRRLRLKKNKRYKKRRIPTVQEENESESKSKSQSNNKLVRLNYLATKRAEKMPASRRDTGLLPYISSENLFEKFANRRYLK